MTGSPWSDVAETLCQLAEVGPFFAVMTGPVAESGWRPVRALYEDPAVLAALVERVGVRLGVGESRVAASILFQGYAARLWSVNLGALVHKGRVPRLGQDALLWHDDGGSLRLHLDPAEGWRSERPAEVLRSSVVAEHLAPLLAAVRRLCPLADQLLWGNAASALLGAAHVLDGAAAGPGRLVAERLLAQQPLCGTVEEGPDGGHRRRSCCLYYRVPGAGVCGDCVLSEAPDIPARPVT